MNDVIDRDLALVVFADIIDRTADIGNVRLMLFVVGAAQSAFENDGEQPLQINREVGEGAHVVEFARDENFLKKLYKIRVVADFFLGNPADVD